jgi:hypothetical protein
MGFFTRMLVPRGVRRAAHPVRSVKRAVTPKVVKRARRALSPVDNAAYSVERKLNTKPRRRTRATTYTHPNCTVKHRTYEAAEKCAKG